MRDIAELTDKTSSYELFTHIYWQIMTRKITGFAELVEHLVPVEDGPRKDYVLKSAFPLIREIHWGFFRDLNPTTFPRLWGELTRPHRVYSFGGELKLSMTIPDIYCGFIDIHGYTAFANSAKDAPMLRLLDDCIETDIKQICRNNHVIANRARGDEIILIGICAYDVVNSTIMIADYFGDKRLTGHTEIIRNRRWERPKLPELSISAGIAGGKKYTSLVITAEGDLSGTVVNTAARLQSRANTISPDQTRILSTETVRVKYSSEMENEYAPMFTESQLAFFGAGPFEFKGVEIRLTDVLIRPEEMYRVEYQTLLDQFLDALKNELWQDGIFLSLVELLLAALKTMPDFVFVNTELPATERETLIGNLRTAAERFESGRDFSDAVEKLELTIDGLAKVANFDHFVLLYARAVSREYRRVFDSFAAVMEDFTDKNRKSLLGQDENRRYEESLVQSRAHRALRRQLVDRIGADKRRLLWKRLVKSLKPSVSQDRYLGK